MFRLADLFAMGAVESYASRRSFEGLKLKGRTTVAISSWIVRTLAGYGQYPGGWLGRPVGFTSLASARVNDMPLCG